MQEATRTTTEATSLLQNRNGATPPPRQRPDVRGPRTESSCHPIGLFTLMGLGMCMFVGLSYHFTLRHGSPSQPSAVDMRTLSPNVTNSSYQSFQQVAEEMMPAWYDQMLSGLPVLTPNVQPDEVYQVRKTILKTRDLLDVFSPTYPNATGKGKCLDTWTCLRHHVAMLYRSVGDFQDLYNCHIMYSQPQMEAKRDIVMKWVNGFQEFLRTNPNLPQYLSEPTESSYMHKESHLFWYSAEHMPRGSEPVTSTLQKLGSRQVRRAFLYLRESLAFQSIQNDTVHEIFHNFRKELRSITDEFDLFLSLFFPISDEYPWEETDAKIELLKAARKHLGDINDDWTALSIYEANDEYPLEQDRLSRAVDDGWANFTVWVKDSNLTGALHYLAGVLEVPKPDAPLGTLSLMSFLAERKKHPTHHFVIGNEAGDADTIISAISLAYIESTRQHRDKTPIVAIPQADLETQRPEVKLLLELAGISHPSRVLIFVDDTVFVRHAYGAKVTLVDHNVVSKRFQKDKWIVSEIVDHHEDSGKYTRSCNGSERTIAFAGGEALVASACTLVAERLKQTWDSPYPASLSLILLGTILLDSVDLSDLVGKVTQRDRVAAADLLAHTEWQDLPPHSKILLGMNSSCTTPTFTTIFDLLQDAKYDAAFWQSLSVRDALRLDYKQFPTGGKGAFGISTVLMPMLGFLKKDELVSGTRSYMQERKVSFLAIMFAYEDSDGRLNRQLAICGTNVTQIGEIGTFLLQSVNSEDSLDLQELTIDAPIPDGLALPMRLFDQQNVKPSRKQIGPLLQEYFAMSE
eukprot:scaffold10570_cov176-Amphora_coffeaeformis.AAC.42